MQCTDESIRSLAMGSEDGSPVMTDMDKSCIYNQAMANIGAGAQQALTDKAITSTLTIALNEDSCQTPLLSVLGLFRNEHPHFSLKIYTDQHDLLRQAALARPPFVDLVLLHSSAGFSDASIVRKEQLVWLAAPDYQIPASGAVSVILPAASAEARSTTLSALRRSGREWAIRFEGNSNISITAALRAGMGIASGFASVHVKEGVSALPAGGGLPELPSIATILVATRPVYSKQQEAVAQFIKHCAILCLDNTVAHARGVTH